MNAYEIADAIENRAAQPTFRPDFQYRAMSDAEMDRINEQLRLAARERRNAEEM